MKHAYLTKVLVQTVWVVVDDATGEATEMADSGVSVPAADWPGFYERHCAEFAAIRAATMAEGTGEPAPRAPGPNRASRRAKPRPKPQSDKPAPG